MFVVRAYLPDNVRNEVYSFVEKVVGKLGGKITLRDIWGKRYMAYRIRGQKEGYYVVYQITMDPVNISRLKKELLSRDEIIRHVISKIRKSELGLAFGKKTASKKQFKS